MDFIEEQDVVFLYAASFDRSRLSSCCLAAACAMLRWYYLNDLPISTYRTPGRPPLTRRRDGRLNIDGYRDLFSHD